MRQAQRHLVALVAIQPFARLLEVEAAQRLHARPDPAPRPPAMQARAGQGALVGNKRDRLRLAMGSAQRRIVADHHLMAFFVVDEAVVQAGIFQQAADEGEVRFVVLHAIRQRRQLAGIEVVAEPGQLRIALEDFLDDLQHVPVLEDAAVAAAAVARPAVSAPVAAGSRADRCGTQTARTPIRRRRSA
ncbi:hypothetical protein G6F50_014474 [Rhizopus delemar]|uniref:Uncharacterized protein n=1 Tax=Rhizopus delemar TaxID=936053 RepID=A0A9P7C7N2_9FUNG|nr:hypothetical protein G6F50_014474 [Rhizopus delemar]